MKDTFQRALLFDLGRVMHRHHKDWESLFLISLSGFLGDGEHRFEIGSGVILGSGDGYYTQPYAGFGFRFGYRYWPLHGGFNFGFTFTPIILNSAFTPWGGISLGWGF